METLLVVVSADAFNVTADALMNVPFGEKIENVLDRIETDVADVLIVTLLSIVTGLSLRYVADEFTVKLLATVNDVTLSLDSVKAPLTVYPAISIVLLLTRSTIELVVVNHWRNVFAVVRVPMGSVGVGIEFL